MYKVGIIGATGYAGAEIVRILLNHPYVELAAVGSRSYKGKKLSEVYPNFKNICDMVLLDNEDVIEKSDVVFAALPHGLSQDIAKKCYDSNVFFIDIGADFRLHDEQDYKEWYGLEFDHRQLHNEAVYGLPELFGEQIKGKRIIANPGCYPTSIALGLYPALKESLICKQGIVIDSKSGVTGAGRGLSQTTHYPDCNEAFSPYKIAAHRHTPEIEQTLSLAAGEKIKVTFVPHLLPVNRGIVSTMYAQLCVGVTAEQVRKVYQKVYGGKQFVRILADGDVANLKNVKYTNMCDISLHTDTRTGRLIVVSAIDNMVKGAAGQAVQNMNIILGVEETAGLSMVPPAF